MRTCSYLMLSRHNVFYFRWPIPQPFHPAYKRTHIKVSLRTREPRIALQLARILMYRAEQLVYHVSGGAVRYDEIRTLLKGHFTTLLEQRKAAIAESGRLSAGDRATLESSISVSGDADIFNLADDGEGIPVDRLIERYGLTVPRGSKAREMLQAELQRSYSAFCQEVLDYDDSLERYNLSEASETSVHAVTSNGTTLSGLIDVYANERMRGGNWTARTERDYRSIYGLLCEMLDGDMPCMAIDVTAAQKVKATLGKVPKNIKVNPKTRDLPFAEAIALDDVERMQVKTMNKHLAAYNGLFGWAEKNSYVSKNVFAGMTIKQRQSTGSSRAAFSNDQIELMVRTILRNEQGRIKKDYQKWGPLLGLYTGARLNEISQLRLEDIREEEGVWCFDINERAEGVRLKTASATRLIPVHSRLLELGLIDYVKGLGIDKESRLLHELGYSEGTGYGRNLSRWFNGPFLKGLGMNGQGLVFHSFRHTMVTNLMQSGIEEPLVKSIIGHAQEGVTQSVYFGEGYTVAQKQAALESLSWKS